MAEVTDLWPLSFVYYGMISARSVALAPMYAYEKRMYEYADDVIFSCEGGYDYIVEKGWDKDIPREKVHYINNGIDLEAFEYNREHFVLDDPDLDDSSIFKVVYTGSIRHVNNLGLLLDAAKAVDDPRIKFLIWGDGDELPALRRRTEIERIANVIFKGRVDKTYIPSIVSRADLNFSHNTASPLFRFGISFNKIFDYLAAGKPILSDFPCKYNPTVQSGAGVSVDAPIPATVAEGIERLSRLDAQTYSEMCQKALDAASEFDFKRLTERLLNILGGN